jgi:hypothetical protein
MVLALPFQLQHFSLSQMSCVAPENESGIQVLEDLLSPLRAHRKTLRSLVIGDIHGPLSLHTNSDYADTFSPLMSGATRDAPSSLKDFVALETLSLSREVTGLAFPRGPSHQDSEPQMQSNDAESTTGIEALGNRSIHGPEAAPSLLSQGGETGPHPDMHSDRTPRHDHTVDILSAPNLRCFEWTFLGRSFGKRKLTLENDWDWLCGLSLALGSMEDGNASRLSTVVVRSAVWPRRESWCRLRDKFALAGVELLWSRSDKKSQTEAEDAGA